MWRLPSEHQEPYLAVMKTPKWSCGKSLFSGNSLESTADMLCFAVSKNQLFAGKETIQQFSLGRHSMG